MILVRTGTSAAAAGAGAGAGAGAAGAGAIWLSVKFGPDLYTRLIVASDPAPGLVLLG